MTVSAGTEPRLANLEVRVADELVLVQTELEALGVELAQDSSVARNHFTSLQSIDELRQRLGHLATLLMPDNHFTERPVITLESLRTRLDR
jgi:hypothetical protein